MKRPKVWWDEQDRFARRAAAAFPWFVGVSALIAVVGGLIAHDQTALLGALAILGVGVGSVVLWVVAAVPTMLIFVAVVSVVRRLQRPRRRSAV